jgi:hypothetical protein
MGSWLAVQRPSKKLSFLKINSKVLTNSKLKLTWGNQSVEFNPLLGSKISIKTGIFEAQNSSKNRLGKFDPMLVL